MYHILSATNRIGSTKSVLICVPSLLLRQDSTLVNIRRTWNITRTNTVSKFAIKNNRYWSIGWSDRNCPTVRMILFFMPCPSMWPKQFWSVQSGFGLTKLIWTWPSWFGHHKNEMVTTKMNWSGPNCHFQRSKITIWTWPIHFGRDHFILVVTKSLWSSPNQFGQTKTILDRPKLFWSHRRTRHNKLPGAQISVIFGWDFGRKDDLINSFWI